MKNKLFKIGKPMLSILIAVTVLAGSLFAVVPGINLSAYAATVTDTWDGTLATGFESGTGTKDDPYIIATAEQLAYAALGDVTVSRDKYFKVVDNATFDLSGMEGITLDSTVGDVKSSTQNKNWRPATDTAQSFSGYFDGNGVVVYNMCSAGYGYSGLFPRPTTNNSAMTGSIKNVTVLNSRSNGYHYAGAIVGLYDASTTAQKLSIENCVVKNCWISDNNNQNGACNRTSGIIAGSVAHNNSSIKNCIAVDNITSATDISGGLVGSVSAYCPGIMVQSCIVVGSSAYPVKTGSKNLPPHVQSPNSYNGVYTDQEVDAAFSADQVKQVSVDNMKGASARSEMPDLDWLTWIAFDGELPDYRDNHTLTIAQGDAATHQIACSDCGKSMAEAHTFVENAAGTIGVCACGYSEAITNRRTDVWDGTKDSNFAAGSGTESDPYIIRTAEQLAYLILDPKCDSKNKYYKVAPNMIFNLSGMSGITLDSTAEDVKNAAVGKNWINDTKTFAGNFDGNGVIIYNIYSDGAYGALFPNVYTDNNELTVNIKNITVMASRFSGYHYSAGIIGVANSTTTSQFLNIENCAVKNCYMSDDGDKNPQCHRTAATIIGNVTHNATIMKNCFALNNILVGTDIAGGFIGNSSAFAAYIEINDSVMIGSKPYPELQDTTSGDGKVIQAPVIDINSYTNNYTDQATKGYGKNQIKTLTIEQMSGTNAPQNTKLDFGSYWFASEGLLDLLVCHNIEGSVSAEDAYAGHTAGCKECGLKSVVTINHTYTNDYKCTVCGFTCDHKNDEYITKTEFKETDCVTPKHTKNECACGYTEQINHTEAPGHVLEKTDAVAPTCADKGNIEYWTCENCECIFLTDDVMAPYDTAVTEKDVTINATGQHTIVKDSNGEIVYGMDGESHWMNCDVCHAKLSRVEHTVSYTSDGAASHDGTCTVCLYEAAENQVHFFGVDDEKCNDCKWVCLHEGSIVEVKAADATCSTEGAYDHYMCTVCDMRFEDAAGTVEVARDTVVIEKLGHDHIDVDENGTPVHEFTETHHWYNCKVCGKGDYAEHTIAEDTENYEGTYKWCEDESGYGCNYSTFDYNVVNEDEAITVTAPTNAFTKDVITDLFKITKQDLIYEEISKLFADAGYENFDAYEISPNQEIANGKKATITTVIPDIYGLRATWVYVDLKNGKIIPLNSTVTTIPDPNANKGIVDVEIPLVSVDTDTFGYFAIVSSMEAEDNTNNNNNANNNGGLNGDNSLTSPPTGDSFAIAIVTIALLASVTILFVRKAKI